jgi:hypothetical protein
MIHDVRRIEVIPIEGTNNSITIYRDTNGDQVGFESTDEPFVWVLNHNYTSPCYRGNKAVLEAVANAYVEQQEYAGGFDEATEVLTIEYNA